MKYNLNKYYLYFAKIIFLALIIFATSCRKKAEFLHEQNFINTIQQKEIIDSIQYFLAKQYIFENKATAINKKLKAYKKNIKSKNPDEFVYDVNKILYENSKDKHLRFTYDTTFARSLIYKNMLVKNWNERKYFEAYTMKDKELVSKNFEFKKVEVLNGNVGYLKFNYFPTIGDGQETFEASLTFLKNVDALIIDLEHNKGGSLQMCEFLLSYFFNYNSPLFYNHNVKKNDTLNYVADKIEYLNKFKKIPLFIMVGENTASAAEIFSNTMKEKVRGRVIGNTTWGGAHVCNYKVLNEAFCILIPHSQVLGPYSKKNWETTGIKPHNKISSSELLNFSHQMAVKQILKKTKNEKEKAKLNNLLTALKAQKNNTYYSLNKYVGKYKIHSFFIKNEKLFWKKGRSRLTELQFVNENTFIALNNSFTKIKFDSGIFGINGVKFFVNDKTVKYYEKN